MTWTIRKDSLYSDNLLEIGYFLPTANDIERIMLKNGDELIDLVGEFIMGHDEGKNFTKKLHDKFAKIIDENANYNLNWLVTREGELLNESENVIFIFVNKESVFAKIIQFLPEVYSSVQELLKMRSSSSTKQSLKTAYNKICKFYDKTSD